jgi:hypothetical protein
MVNENGLPLALVNCPETTPAELRARPGGSVPLVTVQVIPLAAGLSVNCIGLMILPTVPPGKVVGEIVALPIVIESVELVELSVLSTATATKE